MKIAEIHERVMDLVKTERAKDYDAGINAIVKLYREKKDSFTREEFHDICEKYFLAWGDVSVKVSAKKRNPATKRAKTADAK